MPATRPRASFDPISPEFDLSALVEETSNFAYVDRISCDMIDQQGLDAFDKLVLLHVIIGGKPLVIDGYHSRLDPWTFSSKWLQDNVGDKVENARNLTKNEPLPLTIGHYLKNMSKLTEQYFDKANNYRDKNRQRVYLKDIDCPDVWLDKLREHLPPNLFYLNENTGDIGGPGSRDETMPTGGKRKGHGIGPAGDLMSSLPAPMRAENLMCYIGHEGTYTPAHREMCGSLGHNIMVEASDGLGLDGKPERSGSSIWFMTESKDRETVAEYWLSILGHDIEVENHFAQVMAWKKAPFTTYVVEQRPGDFILIPPLAPHQVWNRGTRTMKVAWNRTTAETLELAMKEALPNAKMVCRDEQYKNKAIIFYTLQKYSNLLARAKDQEQTASSPQEAAAIRTSPKIRQLQKDFRKLFQLFKSIMLSEMFAPDSHEKNIQLNPFDSNITCAYCRGNIFNRFLTCTSCDEALGTTEPEPYDVCMECYSMGRSCGCISKLRWAEQFKWKELLGKYELWRQQYLEIERKPKPDSPLPLNEERQRLKKKTLAQICQEQLKRRPWVDIKKVQAVDEDEDDEGEEIEVNDDGTVKKTKKRKSESWLKNRHACHVCQKRHEKWKMAPCKCGRWWCYGSLFRAHDLMPRDVMADPDWTCPHCQNICGAGSCRKDSRQTPYQPKGTLLGHDTRKVADVRSVESLVDFSVSNLSWLKETAAAPAENQRLAERQQEANRAKAADLTMEDGGSDDENRIEYSPGFAEDTVIDPLLDDSTMDTPIRTARPHLDNEVQSEHDGYQAASHNGYIAPHALMYQQPVDDEDLGDLLNGVTELGTKRKRTGDDDGIVRAQPRKRIRPEDRNLTLPINDATKQYRKQEERKALEAARKKGRFIQVHAALKGKTKLVKLAVPQEVLARLQSSAPRIRAPIAAAPAIPQVDDLLRSDLAPAPTAKETVPTKVDTQTKHVRVRVEEDDDFDARHRKRRSRKSAGKPGRKPGTYEELEIESEPENIVDEGETTGTTLRTRRQARRQGGDDGDDDEVLVELPDDWKDGTTGRNRTRAPPRGAAARSSIGGKGVSRLQPQRADQREEANRLAKLAAATDLASNDNDDEEDEEDEEHEDEEMTAPSPPPTFSAINAAVQGGAKAVAVSSDSFVKSVALGGGSILNRTGLGVGPIKIVGASNRRKTTDGMAMGGKAVGKVNVAKSSPLTK